MNAIPRYGLCGLLLISSSILFFSTQLWAQPQPVGKAVGAAETPEKRPIVGRPIWTPINVPDPVLLPQRLRTTQNSDAKLDALLDSGHKFILGPTTEIRVVEPIPPVAGRTDLILAGGIVRVITSGRPGTSVVTLTPAGEIVAGNTGYIVACGPPLTTATNICLYVGLYDRSAVSSAGVTVPLDPQYYTYVQDNQPPSPNPAEPLSGAQFQGLLDATTVEGTGAEEDRLVIAKPPGRSPGPLPPPEPCRVEPCFWPIPEQPLPPFFPLPLPPPPPPLP